MKRVFRAVLITALLFCTLFCVAEAADSTKVFYRGSGYTFSDYCTGEKKYFYLENGTGQPTASAAIPGSGYTWYITYDSSTSPKAALILNGASLYLHNSSTFDFDGDIKVVLNGSNSISTPANPDSSVFGRAITTSGDLYITGAGSLTVDDTSSHENYASIEASNFYMSGGTVKINGNYRGLRCSGNVNVSGGTLTVSGKLYGIYAAESTSSTVSISGGADVTVSTTSEEANARVDGIYTKYLNIMGGTLTATDVESTIDTSNFGYGIYCMNDMTVSGSSTKISGDISCAGSFTMTGGSITGDISYCKAVISGGRIDADLLNFNSFALSGTAVVNASGKSSQGTVYPFQSYTSAISGGTLNISNQGSSYAAADFRNKLEMTGGTVAVSSGCNYGSLSGAAGMNVSVFTMTGGSLSVEMTGSTGEGPSSFANGITSTTSVAISGSASVKITLGSGYKCAYGYCISSKSLSISNTARVELLNKRSKLAADVSVSACRTAPDLSGYTEDKTVLVNLEGVASGAEWDGATALTSYKYLLIAPTAAISLSPSGSYAFPSQIVGYSPLEPLEVTVANTGTGATGALKIELSGKKADDFTISDTSLDPIAADGTDSFTIVPNDCLPAGKYSATVTVSAADGNSKTIAPQMIDVTFTVKKDPSDSDPQASSVTHSTQYTLTFDTNGGEDISSIRRDKNTVVDLSGYAPARAGYTFDGWYADPELTEKITSVTLTGSKTVYAGWTAAVAGNPDTGDHSAVGLTLGIAALAAAGFAAAGKWKKRRD